MQAPAPPGSQSAHSPSLPHMTRVMDGQTGSEIKKKARKRQMASGWLTLVPGKKWGPCLGYWLFPKPPRDFLRLFLPLGNRATCQHPYHLLPVTVCAPARMWALPKEPMPTCLPVFLSLPCPRYLSPCSCHSLLQLAFSRYFCI